jgi:hypothetical protein
MPRKNASTTRRRRVSLLRDFLSRNLAIALFVVLFAGIGVKILISSYAATPISEHIVATLYAYPTLSSWQQVEAAAPTVSDAIVDVCAPDGTGSGCNGNPADAKNTDWTATINTLKSDGITPLYYISTNYGATALSTLESELQQAISWYGTPSPMFDTMEPSGSCSNGGDAISCVTYNNDLYTYAVNAGASAIVYNPGSTYGVTTADIFGSKEIIQLFEGSAASFESTSFPSWMSSYSPSQFVATLSAGSTSTVGTDVSDAAKDHIGNFYEDDEAEPPNYSTLPSFWSSELSDVANTDSSTGSTSTSKTASPPPSSPTPTPEPTKTTTTSTTKSNAPSATPPTVASSGASANKSTSTLSVASSKAQVSIDGTAVSTSSGSIATSDLTNGVHKVVVKQDGKAIVKTIYVHNKLNPFDTARNIIFAKFIGHPLVMNLGMIFLIFVPVLAIVYFLRTYIITATIKRYIIYRKTYLRKP